MACTPCLACSIKLLDAWAPAAKSGALTALACYSFVRQSVGQALSPAPPPPFATSHTMFNPAPPGRPLTPDSSPYLASAVPLGTCASFGYCSSAILNARALTDAFPDFTAARPHGSATGRG